MTLRTGAWAVLGAGLLALQVSGIPIPMPAPPPRPGYSPVQIWLSLGVLLFGAVVLGLQIYFGLRAGRGWDAGLARVFLVTLVIVGSLFVIVAGYTECQIAPVIGLLGTIVGFLLARPTSMSE